MLKKILKIIKDNLKKIIDIFSYLSITAKIFVIICFAIFIEITTVNIYTIIDNLFITHTDIKDKNKLINISSYLSNKDKIKKIKKIEGVINNINYIELTVIDINNHKIKSDKIPIYSFIRNFEPILIKNNIDYHVNFDEKEEQSKYFIINFILKNLIIIIFILFFIFIFEKNGIFAKDKYHIINTKDIKGDFKDLIGLEEIKEEIFQLEDILNNPNKYKEFAIENTFNILMHGPSGTGKTKLASYLAKKLDIPFIIGTGNVETGYVAGGANVIKDLFKKARMTAIMHHKKSCIIFLDEAQILLAKRGKINNNKYEDDSTNELLAQLDGVKTKNDVNIIFIAASNFNSNNMDMDEAILRRFHKKIFFRLPNKSEREQIFKYYINKIDNKHLSEDIDYRHLSEISEGLAPAIIETIVKESGLYSIIEEKLIDTNLIEKAFERIIIGKSTYSKEKDEIIKIIAYHEIGHFIQQFEQTKNKILKQNNKLNKEELLDLIYHNIPLLKISTKSILQYDTLGYVLNKKGINSNIKTKKELENEIVILYGGIAAEKIFFSSKNDDNITTGSSNDIEKISNLFNTMINKLGMYSENKKINLNLIDNINMEKDNTEILLNESEKLYQISIENIINNIDIVIELAELLIRRKELNIIEVFNFLKNRN